MLHKQQVKKIMLIELFRKKRAYIPKGEVSYSSFKLIPVIFLNVGAFLLVNKIGIRASDINKELK